MIRTQHFMSRVLTPKGLVKAALALPVLLVEMLTLGCARNDSGTKLEDHDSQAGQVLEAPAGPSPQVGDRAHPDSAFKTGVHPNLFVELGLATEEDVRVRVQNDYRQLFFGDPSEEAVLYPAGEEMAYIYAPDSNDIRSEGMSYGMIISVMMDDQRTFNKLWRFARTHMQVQSGDLKGYFSWQLESEPPFSPIDPNPASDGEEYFAMSLFFAHWRWGSEPSGLFDYRTEANQILHDMVHKDTPSIRPLMNAEHKQIVFTPDATSEAHTDPSYHLPAFYELWALWADNDNEYWRAVADTSREFFPWAAHPETGLFPEYSTFDGKPQRTKHNPRSHLSGPDAYRVIHNMAMDYAWFSQDRVTQTLIDRLLTFYHRQGLPEQPRQYVGLYELEGHPLVTYRPQALVAMNAVGALASRSPVARGFVQDLWDQPVPSGKWRYYNGLLHMMGLLHVSGNFKIYGNPRLHESVREAGPTPANTEH